MHLYGGFFETVTGFANKGLGYQPTDYGYHNIRHVSSAILGWVAMLCAALLAGLIGGQRAAIITFIVMLVSPRFVGDSMMNPKDIPFAAGYIMAIYNMVAALEKNAQSPTLESCRNCRWIGHCFGYACRRVTFFRDIRLVCRPAFSIAKWRNARLFKWPCPEKIRPDLSGHFRSGLRICTAFLAVCVTGAV